MWSDRKSLILSKVCIIIFMATMLVFAILAPTLVGRFVITSETAKTAGELYFLITIYLGLVPAAMLLTFLYSFLRRIGNGQVFVKENISCLRYISWCCVVGAVISLISAFFYLPWSAIGVAALFAGIIMRVMKNVFAKAVALAEDAKLTI